MENILLRLILRVIINLENMVNDYEQFGYPRLYFIFLSLS